MTRSALIVVLMSWPALSQVSNADHPWDSLFHDSWAAQTQGDFAKARAQTEKAWTMVKLAGPAAIGYSDGVEKAYATVINVSGTLRAESIYAEALKASEAAPFQSIRLQILLRMAFRLVTQQQEVKAKRAYEEALALAESMSIRPRFYGRILVCLAQLQEKMGNPADAEKLLGRAVFGSATDPLPYPRFGMADEPPERPPTNLAPDIKRLVYEAEQLILKGEYERGSLLVDEGFALAETYPQVERFRQGTYFSNAATAFSRKGRIGEASEILQRDVALAEKFWGPEHPAMLLSLMSTAWVYINDLQILKPADELLDRATRLVVATSGETSPPMEFIEQTRLRLEEIQKDSAAVSEHTAKLQQLWAAIHGANTKPLVIP